MLKWCMGKLIHTVWWLLTITSPKCSNPPLASSNSKCDRKMPSMALLPCWCITNGELPCSDDIASTKCVSQQNFIMSGASTSSFMLARTSITSPSSCYCLISVAKLVSHSFLGHFVCLCNCCWYVVRGPSDLHGLEAATSHSILLCFPLSLAQHHCPRPILSSLGCCAWCVNW